MGKRIPLYCDCCGREILAEVVIGEDGFPAIVIRAKRHGDRHTKRVRWEEFARIVKLLYTRAELDGLDRI